MKILLTAFLFLAACASIPVSEDEQKPDEIVTSETEKAHVAPKSPVIRKARPQIKQGPTPETPEPALPPCPLETSDPKQQIIQKLDCLLEDQK